MSRVRFSLALLCALCAVLALVPAPLNGQIVVKNEDVTFKFGIQGQLWADWTQDNTGAQNYQQNFYFRRARLIMGGDIGKNISFFFETDDPKLGITPKNLATGFIVQDLLLTFKPSSESKAFMLDGGLIFVPFSRNGLQSTLSYYTLDVSPISTVTNSVTQSSALRDLGFEGRGYLFKDKFQYRVGAFSGERDSNAHNSLRGAGYFQYDFFAPETGYLFTGTALGKQKILAVDAGFDKQSTYAGQSANIAAAIPVNNGDEVGGQFQFIHYNGKSKFLTIPNQKGYLLEADYYVHQVKVQPFFKYEAQTYADAVNATKDVNRAGFGANYYFRGQNLKWTMQYLRAIPQNGSPLKATNEMTIQLQLMYW
jgi:hypothetical protein